MNWRTALIWAPRILILLVAAFFLLMASDIFSEGYSVGGMLLGFLMHNIPTIIFVAVLILTWNRPKWGGLAFAILGFITIFFFDTLEGPVVFFIVSFPILLEGEEYPISTAFDIMATPTVFLIDRDGTVRYTTMGFMKPGLEAMADAVADALGKPHAPLVSDADADVPMFVPG